jgi:hypothetical protein
MSLGGAVAAAVGLSLSQLGCGLANSGRLETGYRYRALGDTEPERRAYYTDTYSLEALMAQQAADQNRQSSQTGPGRR